MSMKIVRRLVVSAFRSTWSSAALSGSERASPLTISSTASKIDVTSIAPTAGLNCVDTVAGSGLILPFVLPESPLRLTEHGLVPTGKGWFVLNAREAPWYERDGRGFFCEFEGFDEDEPDFSQLGINLTVLRPGEPMAMYHWEADQEDFLVIAGEALLIVEGEERPVRQWDLVHCPPKTEHTIVGAGETACVIVAVGARDRSTGPDWGAYTAAEAALRHDAGVEQETTDREQAYARFAASERTRYLDGLLPS